MIDEDKKQIPAALPWWDLILLTIVYFFSAQGRVGNVDSSTMLCLSRSLLAGKLEIPEAVFYVVGSEGVHFSQFGILQSIIWMPFVLLGRLLNRLPVPLSRSGCEEFVVSFCAPLLMLSLLWLLVHAWRRRGCSAARIRSGFWIVGLGTMFWPFAKLPGSDVLMALAIVYAWYRGEGARSISDYAWVGFSLGLALLARKQAQSIIPVLSCLFLVFALQDARPGSRFQAMLRAGGGMGIGLMGPVLVSLWYNFVRFGHPLVERYTGAEKFVWPQPGQWLERALLMLVGDRMGIVWYNLPIAVAVWIGWRTLGQRDPRLRLGLVALGITQISFLAFFPFWDAGTSFGPRYLFFLAALGAMVWRSLPETLSPGLIRVLGASSVVGALLSIQGILTDPLPVQSRLIVDGGNNFFVGRFQESAVVLGIQARPISHTGHAELTHQPFQVPDVWWCQAWMVLHSRNRPGSAVEPSGNSR